MRQRKAETLNAEIGDLRSQAEVYRMEAARLASEAAFYRTEADRLGSEVQNIGGSTSWKITAPLRWLGDRVPFLAAAGRRWLLGWLHVGSERG